MSVHGIVLVLIHVRSFACLLYKYSTMFIRVLLVTVDVLSLVFVSVLGNGSFMLAFIVVLSCSVMFVRYCLLLYTLYRCLTGSLVFTKVVR